MLFKPRSRHACAACSVSQSFLCCVLVNTLTSQCCLHAAIAVKVQGGKGLLRYAMHVVSKIYHESCAQGSKCSSRASWIAETQINYSIILDFRLLLCCSCFCPAFVCSVCPTTPVSVPVWFLLELVAYDIYLIWLSLIAFEPSKHDYSAETFGSNGCN